MRKHTIDAGNKDKVAHHISYGWLLGVASFQLKKMTMKEAPLLGVSTLGGYQALYILDGHFLFLDPI